MQEDRPPPQSHLRELGWVVVHVMRVLTVLPFIEFGRRHRGAGPLIVQLRRNAAKNFRSDVRTRAQLQRAIQFVDGLLPVQGSCYRRALLAISLDPSASADKLSIGLKLRDRFFSGHAWLPSRACSNDDYDVVFEI